MDIQITFPVALLYLVYTGQGSAEIINSETESTQEEACVHQERLHYSIMTSSL